MAEIRPFRAWRYSDERSKQLADLTSPLLDVVSEKQRHGLYQNEFNAIHLSLPQGPDAARRAGRRLAEWKRGGILEQDPLPGIYVHYQYFKDANSSTELCIKGFLSNIRVYDWDERVILQQESAIPISTIDQVELLEQTQLNAGPTHGVYTDPGHGLKPFMDEAIGAPILETIDYRGVRDVLAVIHDANVIQKFIDKLNDKTILLADGHHRYEVSRLYKKKCTSIHRDHTGKEGYNFHLMYLTNSRALPSTGLYPNVICGLVFSSIKQDEFQTPYYSRF